MTRNPDPKSSRKLAYTYYGGPRINIGGPEDVGIVNNFRANQADQEPQYCIVRRVQEVPQDSHQAAYTRKINYP